MGRVVDRLLLFLFSLAVAVAAAIVILYAFGLLGEFFDWFAWDRLGNSVAHTAWVVVVASLLMVVALRMLYVSLRSDHRPPPSIDQRTGFGDIRISLETVENLTLKAASRIKSMRDLKARVNVSEAGLELTLRAVVDGDTPIPDLSEEAQRTVKEYVEEVTGIPVAQVSVYIANVASSTSFRSRVE